MGKSKVGLNLARGVFSKKSSKFLPLLGGHLGIALVHFLAMHLIDFKVCSFLISLCKTVSPPPQPMNLYAQHFHCCVNVQEVNMHILVLIFFKMGFWNHCSLQAALGQMSY